MSMMVLLFLCLVLAPVVVAAGRMMGRDAGWVAAAALTALTAAVIPWIPTVTAGHTLSEFLPWIPSVGVGLSLRLDGLGMVFLVLILGVGTLVMAYSTRYFSRDSHTGSYYLWMLLFVFSMSGMVIADDMILLFVFWEFTTLCSFFLINRSGPKAAAPAQRTLLITMAGGLSLLTAVLLIIVRTGTTSLSESLNHGVWSEDPAFGAVIAVLIALAAFTKSAQFPFHIWLPDAMVAPAPVSAYLHAAAMVKAGIYLLLRFSGAFEGLLVWQVMLITVGLTTAVLGVYCALQRHDLKEIMAYSTVSQLGFIVAIIGVGTPTALAAALIHVVAHALFKSALFMMVGIIEHQTHTRDIRELAGVASRLKVSGGITLIAALSMAGVPPLLGFVSKENLLKGFLSAGENAVFPSAVVWMITGVAVLAAVGTFAYCGRIVLGAFTGYTGTNAQDTVPEPMSADAAGKVTEASPAFYLPALLPAVAGLVLGFIPGVLDGLIGAATQASSSVEYSAHFYLWGGITTDLVLSLIIMVTGTVVVLGRARCDALIPRGLLPFTGVEIAERMRSGSIAFGRRVGDLTRTDVHGVHLALPGVLLVIIFIAAVLAVGDIGPMDPGHSQPTDWILVVLLVLFLGGAVSTSSRTAAVVLTGGGGFVVSAWYFSLGAVDVGMTQLLVEILTVVVLVLVLRKLPATFHRVRRRRTVVSAVVALSFGLMAFIGTYALTGRRGQSDIAQWYLEETYNTVGAVNIVNSILVDFRALDTLGELTVLGIAGFAILALLNSAFSTTDQRSPGQSAWAGTPLAHAADNTTAMRVVFNIMAPFIVLLSLTLLLRGHYESGGGFIAALVAGGFFALRYLVAPSDTSVKLRFDYAMVIVGGILLGAVIGLTGFLAGDDASYLRPIVIWEGLPLPWGSEAGFTLTTALIFDVGIYLAVVGAVLVALDRLGQAQRYPAQLLTQHMRSQGQETSEIRQMRVRAGKDPGDVPFPAQDQGWSADSARATGKGDDA